MATLVFWLLRFCFLKMPKNADFFAVFRASRDLFKTYLDLFRLINDLLDICEHL
jgi:hypothetical protein